MAKKMTKFFIKKYTPVYKSGNKVCVGYALKKEAYFEYEYNSKNLNLIDKIVKEGVEKEELSSEIFSDFKKANLLEELSGYKDSKTVSRTSLYFEYLNNNNFTQNVKNSKVLVYGAGAVGSTIVYMLAQHGFRHIVVVDDDIINQTDIEKSFVFGKRI
jgi:FlaA1/EpsC-like NDP-sugar epimerase